MSFDSWDSVSKGENTPPTSTKICCWRTSLDRHSLLKLKWLACLLHGLQAIAFGVVVSQVPVIYDYRAPVNLSFLEMYETKAVYSVYETGKEFFYPRVYPAIVMFFVLSFLAEAYSIWKFETVFASASKGYNCIRWFEYAWSSSIMMSVLQGFNATTDAGAYVTGFMCNAAMIGFGGLAEYLWFHEALSKSKISDTLGKVAFSSGLVVGLTPWVVMFGQYEKSRNNAGSIPTFVTLIVITYFLLFMCFGCVIFLQRFHWYRKSGSVCDFVKDLIRPRARSIKTEGTELLPEFCYTVLSVVAKSMFAWLLVGGLNR
jgi:hypothetical protein